MEMQVFVAKDSQARTVLAHADHCRGSDGDGYATTRVAEDIGCSGNKRMILKSGNGLAILK